VPLDLLAYATAFKNTYLRAYEALIEPQYFARLGHLELLQDGRFIGYESSTFGAGYEWRLGDGDWEVRRGSEPVNRLFAPFHNGTPSKKYGINIEAGGVLIHHGHIGEGASLTVGDKGAAFVWRSRLEGNSVVHLLGEGADLVISESDIGSGFGRRFVNLVHLQGSNSAERWGAAAGAAAAQNALLRSQVEILLDRAAHQPFQHLAKNSVLLLGDFSAEGRERLSLIEREVARLGWTPVYADQFDDIPSQDYRSKVLTLASICRFVVVDDSSRAGQLTEVPLVELARTPAAILRLEGSQSSVMTRGIGLPFGVIRAYEYSTTTLADVVETATREAEKQVQFIEQQLEQEFRAWRQEPPRIDKPKYGLTPMVWQSYE